MNLARAFAVMATLAAVSLALAIGAYAATLRMADTYAIDSAHSALAVVARRIAQSYRTQIGSLRSDLTVSLSPGAIDGLGRPLVVATIGDNEGIDGGFFLNGSGVLADGPQRVASVAQRQAVADLAASLARSGASGSSAVVTERGDVVAIDAVALDDGRGIAFARERISGSTLRGGRATIPLVAAAVASCTLLIAIGAWIVWSIRRDVRSVLGGIGQLERRPDAAPAFPRGDFGTIGRAVAEMARRRAQAEERARQSERLAAIGRLAANTAHEIRNPLNALRLQIAVLHRRVGGVADEPVAKLTGEIERLDGVVRRMLETRSDEPLVTVPVDLRDVARRAIGTVEADASARGRRIVFRCDAADPIVAGDAERLVQLAINIIGNAVDAAPAGSEIGVRVVPGPALEIADRGAGIARDDVPRLFEPFFTSKPRGTGLGLAIAHEIARAHGALIDVRRRGGETVFAVTFAGARG